MPIYLQIPTIAGDSGSKALPNQNLFFLMSFAWGVTNSGNGKPIFSSLTVTKVGTFHGPSLMLAAAAGKTLGKIELFLTKDNQNANEVLAASWTLTNASIVSYQESFSSAGGGLGSLAMSIFFTKIEYKQYTANKDGSTSMSDDHFWDIQMNKGG